MRLTDGLAMIVGQIDSSGEVLTLASRNTVIAMILTIWLIMWIIRTIYKGDESDKKAILTLSEGLVESLGKTGEKLEKIGEIQEGQLESLNKLAAIIDQQQGHITQQQLDHSQSLASFEKLTSIGKQQTELIEHLMALTKQVGGQVGAHEANAVLRAEDIKENTDEAHQETRRLFLEYISPMREFVNQLAGLFDDEVKQSLLKSIFTKAADEMVAVANGELRPALEARPPAEPEPESTPDPTVQAEKKETVE